MIVSKHLQKQIILEIGALIILIGAIIYAFFAISNDGANVLDQDGMVMVLDDDGFKAIESLSDGEGLSSDGIKYTVTNNNSFDVTYKLILKIQEDEDILEYIRVGTDDLYIDDILNLVPYDGGYIISSGKLRSGYTKIHTVKLWYKLDADDSKISEDIDYSIELVRE
jgi:hypothetical protein